VRSRTRRSLRAMPDARAPSLAGLVLAGGRSTRFGAEKAVQRLGGATLLERALAALDGVCAAVAVSAGPGEADALARRLGRTVLPDDPTHARGPLTGVAAGLAWARGSGAAGLVTLPCDTPLVDAALLVRLAASAGERGAYARSPDGPHGLVAVWPTSVAGSLATRLAAGDHPSVRGFLEEIGATAVDFADAAAFRNANTRADLAEIAAQIVESSGSRASQTEDDAGTSTTS